MSARRVHVIGIGAGDPTHLTLQAIEAMREVDVFLVADKGGAANDLLTAREELCRAHLADGTYRLLPVADPERGADAPRRGEAYTRGVKDWHAARAATWAEQIAGLPDGAVVGFLVWGDPAFYDSTLRVLHQVAERLPLDLRVTPGITAFQALAAVHGTVLHGIGEPVHVTTGRRLVQQWTPELGPTVVMLDAHLTCRELVDRAPDLTIHWGACLGLPQQEIRAGRLAEVIDEISAVRAALRERHGWVMDVYALGIG
ncbi:precorrin-6A synthase (deacetylating) [Kytococcus sp. Marseille-QA3725]